MSYCNYLNDAFFIMLYYFFIAFSFFPPDTGLISVDSAVLKLPQWTRVGRNSQLHLSVSQMLGLSGYATTTTMWRITPFLAVEIL